MRGVKKPDFSGQKKDDKESNSSYSSSSFSSSGEDKGEGASGTPQAGVRIPSPHTPPPPEDAADEAEPEDQLHQPAAQDEPDDEMEEMVPTSPVG